MRRRGVRVIGGLAVAAAVAAALLGGTAGARADLADVAGADVAGADVDGMPARFPSPASWQVIDLGEHTFGRLATPQAVVARAPASAVTFEHEGASFGPWSFDVAHDGSVWLLDEAGNQILVWEPGVPEEYRAIALGTTAAEDLAVAPDGTLYVIFKPASPDPSTLRAYTRAGAALWTSSLDDLDRGDHGERTFNTVLRFGPDGTLYEVGSYDSDDVWTPLVTPAGTPVPAEQAWAARLAAQPVTREESLWTQMAGEHEYRLVLADAAGLARRAWKIRSTSDLAPVLGSPPALVNDHLVVAVSVSEQSGGVFQHDWLMLRIPLSEAAGVAQLALSPRAVWGDVVSALRVGQDGAVYQLRSSPDDGVSIAQYAFAAARPRPTSTTPGVAPTPTPTASPKPTTATSTGRPTSTTTPVPTATTLAPTPSEGSRRHSGTPVGLAAAGVAALAALTAGGAYLWWRGRHA